jgi:NTP pyrophosphatase (non-canonical NTP hydrolase)
MKKASVSLEELQKKIIEFRDKRNWKQFHNPKDVALSLTLEAGEFMEHYQWKNEKEIDEYVTKNKEALGDELADVLYWTLLASHDLEIDLTKALEKKLKKNEKKYPVKKSKGKHTKYTEL